MSSLPLPAPHQAYCEVSALESGLFVGLPSKYFIDPVDPVDEVLTAPSLSFLLRHSTNGKKLIFDLGVRKDWENHPPSAVESVIFPLEVPQDVVESLQKGGLSPSEIDFVCISHIHFDHVGDPRPFTNSTFLVGGQAEPLISNGYPDDPKSHYAKDLFPEGRTKYLDMSDWKPLGPFPRALDFYGDGSLYITDAPGHLPGHVNILARTSPDGGWLLLGGDSAHHWRLITGESQIASFPGGGCAHMDRPVAEENLARMRVFLNLPRTRIILAHDTPWYGENLRGPAFWPGTIPSM